MEKRPFIIRKWTEGERPVTRPEDLTEGTFDHIRMPGLLAEVDPAAAERYQSQLADGSLKIHRIVKSAETDDQYGVFYVRFTRGSDFPNHSHERSQASIMVIEGEGYVFLDGERFPIGAGDVVHIPPRVAHEFFVARDGEAFAYISITQPDIIRFHGEDVEFDWQTQPSNRYTPDGEVKEV